MGRRILIPFFCILLILRAAGAEKNYAVSQIPPDLLKHADAVIRNHEIRFDVRSLTNARLYEHVVITILNESAASKGFLWVNYDNNTTITSLEGFLYDKNGKRIREFKNREIEDHSAISEGSLYTDDRVKTIRPVSVDYPYTVEYTFELVTKKILQYPEWEPCPDFRVSIESSGFTIQANEGLMPRICRKNLPADITYVVSEKGEMCSWQINNFPAVEKETFGPGLEEIVPLIITAPTIVNADGYEGNFSTWEGVSRWLFSLNKDGDVIDKKFHDKIAGTINKTVDTIEKIKQIYRYMQQTSRYVSVSIGIGGWRAEKADEIASLGYGDCKGLVNYTRALLASFGINSIYTVLNAGGDSDGTVPDFPSLHFSHVILAVPVKNDTIWLECTDQTQPFGFLGSFSNDRFALMVLPNGGRLRKTPSLSNSPNCKISKISFRVDDKGDATVKKVTEYNGLQFEQVDRFLTMDPQMMKDKMYETYDISGLFITSLSISSQGDAVPAAEEKLEGKITAYGSLSGSRMFLPLSTFIDDIKLLKNDDQRKFDIILKPHFLNFDTVEIVLPGGYSVESLPEPANIQTPYGNLTMKLQRTGDTVLVVRRLEAVNGRFPAGQFAEFTAFLRQVKRVNNSKIVLKK
jgi:hypothetical protein